MLLPDSATSELSILTQVLRGNSVTLKFRWEAWTLKLVDLLDLAYQEIAFDDKRQKSMPAFYLSLSKWWLVSLDSIFLSRKLMHNISLIFCVNPEV